MTRKYLFVIWIVITTCTLLLFAYRYPETPPTGTIAYIRGGTEIRLIEPNGNNDRRLWTHADAKEALGINDLAWRPDGKELAFSSSHAAVTSLFDADLYAIKPDGSALRKLTNPPDYNEFKQYPKGTVSITVRNTQFAFQQSQASSGIFIIYVAGAAEPQQITLPPGSSKTLVFKSVADFGNKAQAVVAMWGKFRWFIPGLDVKAGQTVKSPDLTISGNGIELFGAFHPVWRSDGSELSYRTGTCTVDRLPANPPVGEFFYQPMFTGKAPFGACTWDWGPTPELANQVIYTENSGERSGIFRMKEGGTHPGVWLTDFSDIQYQLLYDLHWLPDGSGLLYSTVTLMRDAGNIFHYDFKTKQTTKVTQLENEFAKSFTISLDGLWIIYERSKTHEDDSTADLWMVKIDGSGSRLLVRNGMRPSWGKL